MEPEEALEQIRSILAGLKYEATYAKGVVYDKLRDARLQWKIQINGAEFDFSQGIAHIPEYNKYPKNLLWGVSYLLNVTRVGKYSPGLYRRTDPARILTFSSPNSWKDLPKPELIDVMYCAVSDACAFADYGLKDFLQEFGYTDLINGMEVYEECGKSWRKLRDMGLDPEKLRDLYYEAEY